MTNPNRDGWDWPYILYVGRVWLEYTDREVWALTPRQFSAQVAVHEDILKQMHGSSGKSKNKPNVGKSTQLGFIDQIPGW